MFIQELSDSLILHVSGRDSLRYLNARLSNDIKSLSPGHFCKAAALNPQGRTEGFFSVLNLEVNSYLLICDGGDHEKIITALKRYIVADRVEVTDVSSSFSLMHACGEGSGLRLSEILKSAVPEGQSNKLFFNQDYKIFPTLRSIYSGYDIILDSNSRTNKLAAFGVSDVTIWDKNAARLQRLRAGIVSFPEELNDSRIFSESGQMDAVSFKKGCYVGQEVIEKIDAFAKIPRILKHVILKGALPDGVSLSDLKIEAEEAEPKILGNLISHAYDPAANQTYGFASLKNQDFTKIKNIKIGNLQGLINE